MITHNCFIEQNIPLKLSPMEKQFLHECTFSVIFDAETEAWQIILTHGDNYKEIRVIGPDEKWWNILHQYSFTQVTE